jgi:F-type H+-transporting ATPase subunit a
MTPDIALPSDVLFSIGPVNVTNGVLAAFTITAAFTAMALVARRNMGVVPSRLQVVLEILLEFVRTQLENAFGSKEKAAKFLPMVLTLLLFITVANQFSLVPLVSQIVVGGENLFRVPTSDLSQTFALSLMVVGLAHVLALRIAPVRHVGNFVKIGALLKVRSPKDLGNALLEVFLGVMDIIGEIAKVVSLSCRLFGNVFAGEVMVAVIAGLSAYTQFIVPIPFLVLSIFSGFVQAFVFMLLTVQFIASTVKSVQPPPKDEPSPAPAAAA